MIVHPPPTATLDLRAKYLAISRAAAVELGAAALTLAAIARIMEEAKSAECFATIDVIARRAGRSRRSVRTDIAALVDDGWLQNSGRQRSKKRGGRVRRTNTLRLTEKARVSANPYHRFPEWATALLPRWADRVVFGAVVSTALLVVDKGLEGQGRERLTIDSLCNSTGLSRPTVIAAKRRLEDVGLLEIDHGGPGGSDYLFAAAPPATGKILAPQPVKILPLNRSNSCHRKERALGKSTWTVISTPWRPLSSRRRAG